MSTSTYSYNTIRFHDSNTCWTRLDGYWVKTKGQEEFIKPVVKQPHVIKIGEILYNESSKEYGVYWKAIELTHDVHGNPTLTLDSVLGQKATRPFRFKYRNIILKDQHERFYELLDPKNYLSVFSHHPYTKIFF